MTIIVTQTADNAYHIKDEFRRFDRDCYPFPVYQAIYDYIQETYGEDEVYELDVIAWCCDLSETKLSDHPEFETREELMEYLQDRTMVLCYGDESVYHMAY